MAFLYSMVGGKRKKGQGKHLNDAERIQMVEKLKNLNAPYMRSIAREFEVGEQTIRNIKNMLEMKGRIAKISEEQRRRNKCISVVRFPEIEECLLNWLGASRTVSLVISQRILKLKARDILTARGIKEEEFCASAGWYNRFKKIWYIGATFLYGEGGKVDKNDPVTLEKLSPLEALIETYDYDNV